MKTRPTLVAVLLMMLAVGTSAQVAPAQQPVPTEQASPTLNAGQQTVTPAEASENEKLGEKPQPPVVKKPAPTPPPPKVADPKPAAVQPPGERPVPAAGAAELAAVKADADRAALTAKAAAFNAAQANEAVEDLTGKLATAWRRLYVLAIASAVLGLAAVVLLTIPLFRRKPQPQPEESPLARRLTSAADKLEATLHFAEQNLQKSTDILAATVAGANVVTPDRLNPIQTDIATLRDEVVRVSREVEGIASQPPSAAQTADQVALERQVLAEWWKLFDANRTLSTVIENAERESTWMPLIKELTRVVPADLRPAFDAVVTPCREHWSLLQKIKLVPRVAEGNAGDLATPAEEVRRAREYAGLLQNAQSGSDVASRLTFRFKHWVTDSFLPFADQYLQRYQQARLEKRHHELEPGVRLVRQLLQIAAVEPIEVMPGETAFDSTRHIGRSTTSDQRFADGVITGVVRNGFIEGGQQVIRQPEVIVNRTRL